MKTKTSLKKEIYKIKLPSGEIMTIGPGVSNVPTSHQGVDPKDFSKALKKAVKEIQDIGGIWNTDSEEYTANIHSDSR